MLSWLKRIFSSGKTDLTLLDKLLAIKDTNMNHIASNDSMQIELDLIYPSIKDYVRENKAILRKLEDNDYVPNRYGRDRIHTSLFNLYVDNGIFIETEGVTNEFIETSINIYSMVSRLDVSDAKDSINSRILYPYMEDIKRIIDALYFVGNNDKHI